MTIGTLAQPYAYNGADWVKGNGTNKGMSVYDGSWKAVKELYTYNGSSWDIVHPVHGVSCTLGTGNSNGTCGAVNASYRIVTTWFGPMPQNSGTDRYQIKHYERRSTTAFGIFGAAWQLVGTTDLSTNVWTQSPIFFVFVIGGSSNRRWQQAQGRLVHTVHGDVPSASGGVVTSLVRNFFIDNCGEE